MITANVAPFEAYGDCLILTNGIIDLVVSLFDLRLLRYGFCDNENMLHLSENNPAGGHSLVLRSEGHNSFADFENCSYVQTGSSTKFQADVRSNPDLKYELNVYLSHGSSEVKIVHTIINNGTAGEFCLFAETDMEEGGLAVLPQSDSDTGGCPNRIIAVWPNTSMADPRILWGGEYILVQQANMKPLKFGISAANGWAAYFNMGKLFLMRYPVFCKEPYPDRGCSLAVDTRESFTRLSTRSPLVTIGQDERRSHSESWTLYSDVACPPVDEWPVSETLRGLV